MFSKYPHSKLIISREKKSLLYLNAVNQINDQARNYENSGEP